MIHKKLLVSAALSLTLGVCAVAGISASRNGNMQKVSAYSTAGLTLVTRSNLSTYAGHDVVILSAKVGTPEFQLAWNGSALSLTSTESLVVYTIGEVVGVKFTIYFRDTNHYLGESGGTGFNKTTGLNYGLTGYNEFERPSYDEVGPGWERSYPTMNIGWIKPTSGNPSYYYDTSMPLIMDGTQGNFYLYAITDEALLAANQFAQTFLNTTDGICKDTSVDGMDTDSSALANAWNVKGDGTSLVEKWGDLSPEAKAIFATGTATAAISDANARYVHIMGRYSATLTAFADGPTLTYSAQALSVHNSNHSALIITVIASAALLSAGGFLFARRRREN